MAKAPGDFDRLSVRQLECIVATAEALNFRRAATALGIAQPALSAHVAAAEGLLGTQLFERDRRTVLVTAAGAQVIPLAKAALQAVDAVAAAARATSEPLIGQLRFGVIPTVAPYWLPALLPAVRQRFGKLSLILREEQTNHLLRQLNAGDIDVALLALPVPGDVTAKAICDEEFVFATSRKAGHKRKAKMSAADLHDEEILLLEDGHCLRDQALAICAQAGAAASVSVRATSLPTLVQMVAGNLGSTLLPEAAVPALAPSKSGPVQIERFVKPPPTRTLGLVWRTSSARLKEFRLLAEVLSEAAHGHLRELRKTG